jgi:hypothetical protein
LFPIGGRSGGKCTHQVSTFIWPFSKCIHYSVSIAENVANTLGAFLKESPIPFRYCSNGLQELLGPFLNISWHRFGHFLYISLTAVSFCLLRFKIEDKTAIYSKAINGSSNYDLSNHTGNVSVQDRTGVLGRCDNRLTAKLKLLQQSI